MERQLSLFLMESKKSKKDTGAQKRPRIETLNKSGKAKKVPQEQIVTVFEFWKKVMNKNNNVRLDTVRARNIGAAIYDYGIEGCYKAIEGCALSDFHMGRNATNTKYNDIELILRDATKIERFIEIYESMRPAGEDPF